jgi:hypothetical protein
MKGNKMAQEEIYKKLSKVNVNDKTEAKNGLTYLSWAWAWGVLKENYPTATYTVYENPQGWNYFTDGKTAWVKTGVTVEGLEHIEYLPVMDFRNKSITVDNLTSFDVNKSIQRSLTKAISRHGLGLYIFAGEDLPEDSTPNTEYKASQMVVKDKDEKVRENTVLQLTELFEQLEPEQQGKVNSYLLKVSALKFTDLTEAQGRSLLLNIQGLLSKKVAQ